jgi:hypothetical protein
MCLPAQVRVAGKGEVKGRMRWVVQAVPMRVSGSLTGALGHAGDDDAAYELSWFADFHGRAPLKFDSIQSGEEFCLRVKEYTHKHEVYIRLGKNIRSARRWVSGACKPYRRAFACGVHVGGRAGKPGWRYRGTGGSGGSGMCQRGVCISNCCLECQSPANTVILLQPGIKCGCCGQKKPPKLKTKRFTSVNACLFCRYTSCYDPHV